FRFLLIKITSLIFELGQRQAFFMINSRLFIFVLVISLIFQGCKTSRVSSSQNQSLDTLVVSVDTLQPTTNLPAPPHYITSTGDTLESLDISIPIKIGRVKQDSIHFAAVGDMMMGTNFPNAGYLPNNKGYNLWKEVKEELQDADVTFGNLEGVILDAGGQQKKCNNPKACFLFRTPEFLAFHYKQVGFDLLSVANNHANDFGETGRLTTQRILDSLDILHAGSENVPYQILRQKGYTVGFVAFAPNKGTLSLHDEVTAMAIIKHIDSLTDVVVVSFHAGAEGSKNQHITRKREFYYGEDRGNVYEFARKCIDSGADVLFGHGPHVPRAIDLYKGRIVAYSLGNFLTYGRFNLKGANAYAPLMHVYTDNQGKFMHGSITSYIQTYENGPITDPKNRAALQIQMLTKSDFPESQIYIDDSGRILYLQR
ncbi:MAG: poly-gamma-glutamate capsule biosynthesis protein CapA/YwtB (metallophosphatase superfamily), partial [Cyclobacteriaceae bacterium]